MIQKEVKAKIEYEDEDVLAIHDINPQAPVHLLIMPKQHVARIDGLEESDAATIGNALKPFEASVIEFPIRPIDGILLRQCQQFLQ